MEKKNKCSYDEQCESEAFKSKNNDLYYCHKHLALDLLEELNGNLDAGEESESVETIQGYLEEAIASLKKI